MSPPPRVEIKTIQKPPDTTIPLKENGVPPPTEEESEDLTPDELIATIQSAVDELLLDYNPNTTDQKQTTNDKKSAVFAHVSPTELTQRNEVCVVHSTSNLLLARLSLFFFQRSFSSPSPTTLSTPSPTAQPLPLFLDIRILCKPGVSLGLQLIGGADTAIPAQVEVVMPGK